MSASGDSAKGTTTPPPPTDDAPGDSSKPTSHVATPVPSSGGRGTPKPSTSPSRSPEQGPRTPVEAVSEGEEEPADAGTKLVSPDDETGEAPTTARKSLNESAATTSPEPQPQVRKTSLDADGTNERSEDVTGDSFVDGSFADTGRYEDDIPVSIPMDESSGQLYGEGGDGYNGRSSVSPSPRDINVPISEEPEGPPRIVQQTMGKIKGKIPEPVNHALTKTSDAACRVGNQIDTAATELKDRIASRVPEPVKTAAQDQAKLMTTVVRTAETIPERCIDAIPESVMSRETKKAVFEDFYNCFRAFFNVNVLLLPYAMQEAGIVVGVLFTVIVAAAVGHTTEVFFNVKDNLPEGNKAVAYGDVPRMLWGQYVPTLNIAAGFFKLVAFTVFAGQNFQVLLRHSMPSGDGTYALALFLPLLFAFPMVLMKEARNMRPLVLTGNIFLFVSIVSLFFTFAPWSATASVALGNSPNRFFIFLAVVTQLLEGIQACVPVERTMRNHPGRFAVMLRRAIVSATALLIVFGAAGYAFIGRSTCAVITAALPHGPTKDFISFMLFVTSVAVLPQMVFPIAETIDHRFLGVRHVPGYWDRRENLVRLSLVFLAALLAYAMPFYGLVTALGGAFGGAVLQFLIPALMEFTLQRRRLKDDEIWYKEPMILKNVAIAVVAVGVSVAGATLAILDMVDQYSSSTNVHEC